MNSKTKDSVPEDNLRKQFNTMRAEDRADLPPFPYDLDPGESPGGRTAVNHRRGFSRIGVAAGILVATAIVVTRHAPVDDPAALYSLTMSAYTLQTDELMSVSEDTFPGITGLPELMTEELP